MIEIKDISKSYKKHTVLDHIDLSIHKGDCIGIIGDNGSGKTTLLSIIAGYIKPDSGHLIMNGIEYAFSSDSLKGIVSYVPQENPLMEELSVRDNLRLWYASSEISMEDSLLNGTLHMLGIHEFVHKKVSELSGGMKKRLSIGIAFANQPSLLIMDEPSAALDLSCKKEIRSYMKYFTKQGGCVLLVSHDEPELSICNRLFRLQGGHLSPVTT